MRTYLPDVEILKDRPHKGFLNCYILFSYNSFSLEDVKYYCLL